MAEIFETVSHFAGELPEPEFLARHMARVAAHRCEKEGLVVRFISTEVGRDEYRDCWVVRTLFETMPADKSAGIVATSNLVNYSQ